MLVGTRNPAHSALNAATMRCVHVVVALLSAVALNLTTGEARAVERQWHLGGGLGATTFLDDYEPGPALSLHGAYGLSDMFDLRLSLVGSRNPFDGGAAFPLSATGGVIYKVDIIEWVPYFGVQVGATTLLGDHLPGRAAWLEVTTPLGIDYALSREFALGLELRTSILIGEDTSGSGAFLIRAEHRWGW